MLAVVVVVAVALVVVPFLVPVTNSIWRGEERGRPEQSCGSASFCQLSTPGGQEFGTIQRTH